MRRRLIRHTQAGTRAIEQKVPFLCSRAGISHSPLKFSSPIRRKQRRAAPTSPIKQLKLFSAGSEINRPISPHSFDAPPSLPHTPTPTLTFFEVHPSEFTDGVSHWEDVEVANDLEEHWPVVPSADVITTTGLSKPAPDVQQRFNSSISGVVKDRVFEGISFVARYALEILSQTLRYMISPLSFLLFLLFLWTFLWLVYAFFSPAIHRIHASICILPGTTSFAVCRRWLPDARTTTSSQMLQSGTPVSMERVDYHQVQGSIFEKLLDHASATSGEELSLGIWKVEMDTENLLAYILKSDLEGRDSLVQLMETFAAEVETTASILADLNSKSMGAIDCIGPTVDALSRMLTEIPTRQTFITTNSLPAVHSSYWRPSTQSAEFASAFTSAMVLISDELEPITRSTDIATNRLHEHKQQLRIIHSVIVREERMLSQEINRLQASTWTALGGNRKRLRRLQERQVQVQNLGQYHKRTLAHVGGTLRKLRTRHADTTNLRERALSASQHLPVEIQVKSLMTGLGRLQQAQVETREQKAQSGGMSISPLMRYSDHGISASDGTMPALE